MNERPHYSVSVAGVVVNDQDDVLLIQRRDNGRWEPPGGVLEFGESIREGLRREVREETGLDVEPSELTGVYRNMARGIVSLVFRCKVIQGIPTETAESRAIRWVRSEDVPSLAVEAYAVRVLDGLRNGQPPAVREHDGVNLV